MKRLVITGMGAVTPIGCGVNNYWRSLVAGKCGVNAISRFDASRLPSRIAAEVTDFDFSILPKNLVRNGSPFMQFACGAGIEALEQSKILESSDAEDIAICMGTAMAGMTEIAKSGGDYKVSASGRISPHLLTRSLGNMPVAHIAISLGIRGPALTLNTACSAGGDAVMAAAMLILAGEAKAALVMGGESILEASIVSSLSQAKALSRNNDSPKTASRPFDLHRDGFVIGEGGGAIVLETEEHALARGAKILAVLAGWANTIDGYHVTAPAPDGSGAAKCMHKALAKAGLKPHNIDYINAHGTSTQLGDKAETLALKKVFGTIETAPPISSTKGATGHLMGAGGLTELIACIKAIHESILPATLNLDTPDPDCDLNFIPKQPLKLPVLAAMSNSLGFGGQNSSIIVTKYSSEVNPDGRNI